MPRKKVKARTKTGGKRPDKTKRPKRAKRTKARAKRHVRRAARVTAKRRPAAPKAARGRKRQPQGRGAKRPPKRRMLGRVGAFRPPRAAAAPGQPAYPGFVYNGGPVITNPALSTSFWGALWSDAAHQTAAQRLTQFAQDLLNSDFMNVLSQYGVGTGNGSGSFGESSLVANVASQLADSDIQSVIQSNIDAGVIPEPPANNTSDVLLIFLDENTEVNDSSLGIVMCEPMGDTAFGYHNGFTTSAGNPFYYSVIPALDDACLENSCGGSPGCTLQLSETQEQRRTQVASHEFAEMVTDPNPPTGWYDQTDPNSEEVGDICNGESDTITVGANTWTVQSIYSSYDDQQSGGSSYCLSQAPSPEPLLPGAS
ncbi:MAG TPA: hypothetical protein VGW33_08885 [Terriglobia bacterium]|nr:hypothetical protein [Terriglobia bacterium]